MPSKPAGNSGSTQSVTSTNQVQLPQWIQNAGQDVYSAGQQTAQNLLPAYTGERVAPLNQGQQSAIQALWDTQNYGQPQYQAAQGGAQDVMGYQPQQVTPGWLSGTDLSPYMNPYTQDVIDKTMPLIDQQRQIANNQGADLAAKSGAFGGSRQGIAEGVTNAQSALGAGQLGAQLNAANFAQAQQGAIGDLNRSLAGQQSNQAAGLQGAGLRLNAANSLGNLTQQGQQAQFAGINAALQGQGMLQQNQQQQLAGQQQQYTEQRQQPIDALRIAMSALGGVPYGQTQTSTQTGPGPTSNPYLTGLGALGTGAGILGTVAPLFGAGAVFGPTSDRSLKTDVKKIGKDDETGLPLYSYRYKGDPKTYPKVVGPMAQDIAKKYPDQVMEAGGKLVVNLGFGPMARAFK